MASVSFDQKTWTTTTSTNTNTTTHHRLKWPHTRLAFYHLMIPVIFISPQPPLPPPHPPRTKSPPGRSDPSCSLCSADSSLEVAGRPILSLGGVFLQTYMVWGASWPPGASMGQGQVQCRWKPLPQLLHMPFVHPITAKNKPSLCISSRSKGSATNTNQLLGK